MTNNTTIIKRAKIFFGFTLLVIFLRMINGGLFSSIYHTPFVLPEADNLYWTIFTLKIDAITNSYFVCVLLDMLLLFLPICCILFFDKKIFPILFSILFVFYYIIFNSHTAFHSHSLVGIIFISIAFWFKKPTSFSLAWRAIRYYFIFVMISAAAWKFYRDGIYHFDQYSNLLKVQQVQYFMDNPEGFFHSIRFYLIQNEVVAYILLLCGFIAEASFIIGFFSRQYDKFLLVLFILFIVCNYIFTGISNLEFSIFAILFIDWDKEIKPLFSDR